MSKEQYLKGKLNNIELHKYKNWISFTLDGKNGGLFMDLEFKDSSYNILIKSRLSVEINNPKKLKVDEFEIHGDILEKLIDAIINNSLYVIEIVPQKTLFINLIMFFLGNGFHTNNDIYIKNITLENKPILMDRMYKFIYN